MLEATRVRRSERGYILIVTALSAVTLMAFVGLAVDTGYMSWVRRRAQGAANAAAVAAMLQLKNGASASAAQSSGETLAGMNGFTNGTDNVTVAINNPPLYGSFAGNSQYVEAVVKQTVPTMFMMVLGAKSTTVAARAEASIGSSGGSSGCVYALSKTASRALHLTGSNTVTFACSAYVSSTSSSAYYSEGSITLDLANNAKVGVVGSYQMSNGTYLYDTVQKKNVTPMTVTDPGDPFATLPAPTGLPVVKATATYYDTNAKPTSNTIGPGVYCGGLKFGNTGGTPLKMSAGTYVMAGGGFVMGSQAIVDATAGVTIYNTNSNGYSCGKSYSFAPIHIDGQSTFNMNAPTTGTLAGIAFFQDRGAGATTDQNQIVSQTDSVINGALYFKNSQLLWSGTNQNTGYMILVADTITINGSSALYVESSYAASGLTGSPIRGGGMVASGLVE